MPSAEAPGVADHVSGTSDLVVALLAWQKWWPSAIAVEDRFRASSIAGAFHLFGVVRPDTFATIEDAAHVEPVTGVPCRDGCSRRRG